MKVEFNKEMTEVLDSQLEKVRKEIYLPLFKREEFFRFLCKLKAIKCWTDFYNQFGYDLSKEEMWEEYGSKDEIERLELHLGAYDGFIKGVKNLNDTKHNLRVQQIYLIEQWCDIPLETYIPDLKIKNKQHCIFESNMLDEKDAFDSEMEMIFISQKIETCIRLFLNIKIFNDFTIEQEVVWEKLSKCNKEWKACISQYLRALKYLGTEKDERLIKLTTSIREKDVPPLIKKIFKANNKDMEYNKKDEEKYKKNLWKVVSKNLDRPSLLEIYILVLTNKDYWKIDIIARMIEAKREKEVLLELINMGYSNSLQNASEIRVNNTISDMIIRNKA